jgi:NADH dehydrogenase [ubiquinone] 1 alpha subcomplex assembly factor 7
MNLRERLIAEISQTGPISVADYMMRCLHDPAGGYYATRPALGADGDFLTAPLVSQMFGELIGLWAVETWTRLGSPAAFRLVEIGPGDGTLMSDLLRAVRRAPGFLDAADVWLVETSPPLIAAQIERLQGSPADLHWAGKLDEVPAGAPVILVANELLDCLPARQFVRCGERWIERLVGVSGDGDLAFGLAEPCPAPQDLILEVSPLQEAFGAALGGRIARNGGAALLIDYGRAEPGFGDTLQALKGHRKVDPLAHPGEADLTVHADFPLVLSAARAAGASTAQIVPQGHFLVRLGLGVRAEALKAARPDRAETIERQFKRLADPEEMGELFKAACLHQPGLIPPGFELTEEAAA